MHKKYKVRMKDGKYVQEYTKKIQKKKVNG